MYFIHFTIIGPWEVSPQDALVVGMGVIASESVGSTQVFFRNHLRRFLVPVGDVGASVERMLELLAMGDGVTQAFSEAAANTADYTVEATAQRLVTAATHSVK